MVYNTTMNKIDKMKKPTLNPWVNVKPTTPSAMTQIFRTQKFLFRPGRCQLYTAMGDFPLTKRPQEKSGNAVRSYSLSINSSKRS